MPTLPRVLRQRLSEPANRQVVAGALRRGGFTHGMTQGERHGDQGLDIGRKTMQPIYDFVELAAQTTPAVLRVVRADDAARSAHAARAAVAEISSPHALAARGPLLGDDRMVRRDGRRVALASRQEASGQRHDRDLSGRQRLDSDPDKERYAAQVQAVALRRRPAHADHGALAGQGASRGCPRRWPRRSI